MAKFAFNHDDNNGELTKGLGISDERFHKIVKVCRISLIECSNTLTQIEYIMNELQPENVVEAMYIGYAIRGINERENDLRARNPLMELLEKLGGE